MTSLLPVLRLEGGTSVLNAGNVAVADGTIRFGARTNVVTRTADFTSSALYASTLNARAAVTASDTVTVTNNQSDQNQNVRYPVPHFEIGKPFDVSFVYEYSGPAGNSGDGMCIQLYGSDAGTDGPFAFSGYRFIANAGYRFGYTIFGRRFLFAYDDASATNMLATSHPPDVLLDQNVPYKFDLRFDGVNTWTYSVRNTVTNAVVWAGTVTDAAALARMAAATFPAVAALRGDSGAATALQQVSALRLVAYTPASAGADAAFTGSAWTVRSMGGADVFTVDTTDLPDATAVTVAGSLAVQGNASIMGKLTTMNEFGDDVGSFYIETRSVDIVHPENGQFCRLAPNSSFLESNLVLVGNLNISSNSVAIMGRMHAANNKVMLFTTESSGWSDPGFSGGYSLGVNTDTSTLRINTGDRVGVFRNGVEFVRLAQGGSFVNSPLTVQDLTVDSPGDVKVLSQTANRVPMFDPSKNLRSSNVTTAQLEFLTGLSGNVQTQLADKANTATNNVFFGNLGMQPNRVLTLGPTFEQNNKLMLWGTDLSPGATGGGNYGFGINPGTLRINTNDRVGVFRNGTEFVRLAQGGSFVNSNLAVAGNVSVASGAIRFGARTNVVTRTADFTSSLLYANDLNTQAAVAASDTLTLTTSAEVQVQNVQYPVPHFVVGAPFGVSFTYTYTGGIAIEGKFGDGMGLQLYGSDGGAPWPWFSDNNYFPTIPNAGYRFVYRLFNRQLLFAYDGASTGTTLATLTNVVLANDVPHRFELRFDGSQTWTYSVRNASTNEVAWAGTVTDPLAISRMAAATYPAVAIFRANTGGATALQRVSALSLASYTTASAGADAAFTGSAWTLRSTGGANVLAVDTTDASDAASVTVARSIRFGAQTNVVTRTADFTSSALYASTLNARAAVAATDTVTLTTAETIQYQIVQYPVPHFVIGAPFSASFTYTYTGGIAIDGKDGDGAGLGLYSSSTAFWSATEVLQRGPQNAGYRFAYSLWNRHLFFAYDTQSTITLLATLSDVLLAEDVPHRFELRFDGSQTWTYSVRNASTNAVAWAGTVTDPLAISRMAAATYPAVASFHASTGGATALQRVSGVEMLAYTTASAGADATFTGSAWQVRSTGGANVFAVDTTDASDATVTIRGRLAAGNVSMNGQPTGRVLTIDPSGNLVSSGMTLDDLQNAAGNVQAISGNVVFSLGRTFVANNKLVLYGTTSEAMDPGASGGGNYGLGVSPFTLRLNTNDRVGMYRNGVEFCRLAQVGSFLEGVLDTAGLRVSGNVALDATGTNLRLHASVANNKLCLYGTGGEDANVHSVSTFALGINDQTLRYQVPGTSTANRHAFFHGENEQCRLTRGNVNVGGVASEVQSGRLSIGTTTSSYQLQLGADSAGKPGTGGAWTVTSDARVKANVVPANLEVCAQAVRAIPLRRFEWTSPVAEVVGDQHVMGWVAQEVLPVFPKAVSVSADYGLEDFHSLNPDQIYLAAFGALQKTIADLERLEARVRALE